MANYSWNKGTIGGDWSVATNWTDQATGMPAAAPPGPGDNATIGGDSGTKFQIVAGSGSASSLLFLGNTALEGTFSAGTLTLGNATPASPYAATDAVTIQTGASLTTTGTLSVFNNLEADGPGAVLSTDIATQGTATTDPSEVLVVNGASASAAQWTLVDGDIFVDAAGTLAIGAGGHAAAGALTVEQGATFTATGPAVVVNNAVVDNGLLQITSAGALTIGGDLSGNGDVDIVGSGTLYLQDALVDLALMTIGDNGSLSVAGLVSNVGSIQTGASASLTFLGSVLDTGPINLGTSATATFSVNLTGSSTLSLATDASVEIDGTLSGLANVSLGFGAEITFGQSAAGASAEDTNVPIVLTGQNLIRLDPGDTIGGAISNFNSSDVIQNTSNQFEFGGLPITTATWTAGSDGTGTLVLSDDGTPVDSVLLAGNYAGQQFLTDYAELVSGDSDVGLPGGTQTGLGGTGLVTVTGDTGALFQILAGTGSAGFVDFVGNTAIDGDFTTNVFNVAGTFADTLNVTDIEAGGTLTATGGAEIYTGMELDGVGAVLDVADTLVLGGGTVEAELYLAGGARAEVGDLQLTGADTLINPTDTAKVWVDATSSLEIGTAGTATGTGRLTIDSGATLSGSGLNVVATAPEIVDDGLVTVLPVTYSNVFISSTYLTGDVSGTGEIVVTDGLSLFITGNVTGLSGLTQDSGSSLTITGTLDSSISFVTGANASTTIDGSVYDLARLEVGSGGALSVGGVLTNVAALVLDASASATITGGIISTGSAIGTVDLADNATLTLGGNDANEPITLSGNDELAIDTGVDVSGAVIGFDSSDLLASLSASFQTDGTPITAATVTGSGAEQTLILSDDGTTVSTISLNGSYPGQPFLTNVAGLDDASSDITLPGTVVSGIGSGGTVTGDQGSLMKVETGSGSVSAVTFLDNNALEGDFLAGAVTVAAASSQTVHVLDIEAGASLGAASMEIESSAQIDGASARLTVAGSLTLGGGASKDELYVLNHGGVQAGDIALTGATNVLDSAALLFVDATAAVTVGSGPTAAAGTLQIDAGATLSGSSLNVNVQVPTIVDDGEILVQPPTYSSVFVSSFDLIGNVTGSGSVVVDDGTSIVIQGNAAGLDMITIGNATSLLVTGTMTGVGTVLTGTSSAAEFDSAVTGPTTITEGADSEMTFDGSLSGGGSLTIGDDAVATIAAGVSGLSQIVLDADATLVLTGPDANVPIVMGADSTLEIGPTTPIGGVISGFTRGDVIEVLLASEGTIITGANFSPGTGSLALSDDGVVLDTPTLAGSYAGEQFLTNAAGAGGVTDVTVAPAPTVCFLAGSRIATPSGQVPVEALRVGDLVLTASSAVKPIVWIGSGRVLATRGRRNAATPVIVLKNALAPNVPTHDLRITKAHALYIDDVLIPVEFLVNHRTILWDDRAQEVEIYHVELEIHDVLLANGAPAESYRDDGNRWLFHNSNGSWDRPPLPPCAPVLTGGPIVDAVWRRLLDFSGFRNFLPMTDDPDLHLVADGNRIDSTERHGQSFIFRLPAPPLLLRIASRAAVPAELGLARDPRSLGVALRCVTVRRGTAFIVIQAHDQRLTDGFHGYERADALRWTDGDAGIPVAAFAGFSGAIEIVVTLAGSTRYLDDGQCAGRRAA